MENFAGFVEIIVSQAGHSTPEVVGIKDFYQGLKAPFKKDGLIQYHIKAFTGNRDKAEPQEFGDSARGDAHVGFLGQYGKPNIEMGENFLFISVYFDAGNAKLLKVIIEKHSRSGALLPVDELYTFSGQVGKCPDTAWILRRHDKTQLPVKKDSPPPG